MAVLVTFISVYALITDKLELNPYILFLFGILMLVIGLDELKKRHKEHGLISIVVFLLLLYVSLQGFFMS
ncbi:DUF3953 domain-containing protein [Pontibacillus marinus]|uniref:DUF3953 domain-containing protein n=1 Tax=Pontibacillus marinus TaxID=273164 RepID=UPI0018CDA6F9|nr:DUF3953 domain-containing protein [Pontibacillus marinus]